MRPCPSESLLCHLGFAPFLLGFDTVADYDSLVKEGHGRRVFPAAPDANRSRPCPVLASVSKTPLTIAVAQSHISADVRENGREGWCRGRFTGHIRYSVPGRAVTIGRFAFRI